MKGELIQISIHAPTWGATTNAIFTRCQLNVSIRTPLAGSEAGMLPQSYACRFLSARPERGATKPVSRGLTGCVLFLSARPERGATPETARLRYGQG
ncbi:MAG: hypothetical protein ABR539_10165, partial [Halomonas sp.]